MLESDESETSLTVDQLPQPLRGMMELLEVQRDHPARKWFERIGNGVFEDVGDLPGPHPIYRFRQRDLAAYIWEAEGVWFVPRGSECKAGCPTPSSELPASERRSSSCRGCPPLVEFLVVRANKVFQLDWEALR